ncbi:MAG: hypothetical protein IT440_15735 [Phycisphaeraceae bacterium]|nr:hypothetical protein [Phycisphaeraceae bacterium]
MSAEQANDQGKPRKSQRGVIGDKARAAQWPKGKSGNEAGRPKGKSFKTLIEEVGREGLPAELSKSTGAKTWKELLVRAAFKQALKQAPYFKALLDTEKESNELLTEFLDIVHRYGITPEQIKADPVLREAAIRCGYLSDSTGEDGTNGRSDGAKN